MKTKQPDSNSNFISESYSSLLKEIKDEVRSSQIKAAISVNKELIALYWKIGCAVNQKQE